jgi:rhamnulose-1-phosphate aldolase
MQDHILTRLSAVASLLCERGWAEGPEGNVSIRLPSPDGEPDTIRPASLSARLPVHCRHLWEQRILISHSGARFRDIAVDPQAHCATIHIDAAGSGYTLETGAGGSAGVAQPTSELPTHLLVHDTLVSGRPSQTALLHAHVNELIAMSMHPKLRSKDRFIQALISVHPEMREYFPDGIGFVPYIDAGTIDIAQATAGEFRDKNLVVWQRHGALAAGKDIEEACDHIAIAAKAAALWLMCRSAGFDPAESGG